jgi:hypothetical protein
MAANMRRAPSRTISSNSDPPAAFSPWTGTAEVDETRFHLDHNAPDRHRHIRRLARWLYPACSIESGGIHERAKAGPQVC